MGRVPCSPYYQYNKSKRKAPFIPALVHRHEHKQLALISTYVVKSDACAKLISTVKKILIYHLNTELVTCQQHIHSGRGLWFKFHQSDRCDARKGSWEHNQPQCSFNKCYKNYISPNSSSVIPPCVRTAPMLVANAL